MMNFRIHGRRLIFAIIMLFIMISSAAMLIWLTFVDRPPIALQLATGLVFTLSIAGMLWLLLDPDSHAARQSDELLKLASRTLA